MGENNFSSRPDKQTERPVRVGDMTVAKKPTPQTARQLTKSFPFGAIVCIAICLLLCAVTVLLSVTISLWKSNRDTKALLEAYQPPQQVTVIEQNNPVIDNNGTAYTEEDRVIAVDRADDSVVSIYSYTSFEAYAAGVRYNGGSGVVWSGSSDTATATMSYIVTNQHVIEKGVLFEIVTVDGQSHLATLVGADVYSDLAVLRTDVPLKQATKATDADIQKGMSVIVIGNPTGSLPGSVSAGIVSALEREISPTGVVRTVLQTDAAINNGNSGGGLFDLQGRLIGLANAKRSGDGVWGIGFCIPIDTVTEVCTELIEKGYVAGRPQMGVTLLTYDGTVDITDIAEAFPEIAEHISRIGLYVTGTLDPSSPFQVGDYLYAMDGTVVTNMNEVRHLLSQKQVGDTVRITVFRDGFVQSTVFGEKYQYTEVSFDLVLTQRVEQ